MSLKQCIGRICAKSFVRRYSQLAAENTVIDVHPSAGIIVIGDEILKAQTKDINSHYACQILYQHGINVKKISVLGDNVYEIAKEIEQFSTKYKYVITCGGIGPTHDDVTFQALAIAFQDKLHYHPTLVDIIKNKFGFAGDTSSYAFKMAQIPTQAELKFGVNKKTGEMISYPCIVLKNVHIFPGSPIFFKRAFNSLYKTLFPRATDFHMTELFINTNEESFAEKLNTIATEYPHVSFGSYPEYSRFYKTRITIESNSLEETKKAENKLKEILPIEIIVPHDRKPEVCCDSKFSSFLQKLPTDRQELYASTFQSMLKYFYRPQKVVVFFDGSAESVIQIHFARIALTKVDLDQQIHVVRHDKLHLTNGNGFFEQLCERYNLRVTSITYQSDIYAMLRDFSLQQNNLNFMLVGMRDSDTENATANQMVMIGKAHKLEIIAPLQHWSKSDVIEVSEGLCLPYDEAFANKKQ